MKRLILYLSLLCLLATPALADVSFQFAAPWSQSPKGDNVDGMRLALFMAKNQNVKGFDLGIFSLSESVNSSGVSMIWGMGKVTGQSSGLASAFINYHTSVDSGVNAAFVNMIESLPSGANVGFVNITNGVSNVDVSGMAISDESKVQVGFVNVTKKITGVQIGFLNAAENGIFPVLPFFNLPKD